MNILPQIILQEIRNTLRRKFFLFFAIIAPLIGGIVAIVVYQVNKADSSNGGETTLLEETIEIEGYVDPGKIITNIPPEVDPRRLMEYPDFSMAMAALEAHEIIGFYVIPETYITSGDLDYYALEANPVSTNLNSFGFGRLLAHNLLLEDPAMVQLVMNPISVEPIPVSGTIQENENNWLSEILPLLMVILLYMVILIPASNLISSFTDEKKNQVIEVLLSSISPKKLFVGKLLATGLLGFLQTGLWIAVLWGVATFGGRPLSLPEGFSISGNLLFWALIFSILGFMIYGTQMAGVGALAPNINESRSVSLIIMIPLIVGYSLALPISKQPYGVMAYIFSYFPPTAPISMVVRMTVTNLPVWEPLVSAALQLVFVFWMVRFFGKLIHARLILSGQPLNLKRFLSALRQTS